jgi:hypothetical protein
MSGIFEIDDEIVEIEYLGEQDTIDINVSGNRLFYANGILTHNSAQEEVEFNHAHISGGISKINTSDNFIGIYTSRAMRERGKYQLQLLKTRNSNGVGQKIDLDFDLNTLKVTDCGLSEQDSSNGINNILSSIRPQVQNDTVTASAPEGRVTADVQSVKLKQLLSRIKPS